MFHFFLSQSRQAPHCMEVQEEERQHALMWDYVAVKIGVILVLYNKIAYNNKREALATVDIQ